MTEYLRDLKTINKVKSYIGFAKKSGKLKIGSDNILAYKKFSVIIFSRDISENSKNKLLNHANKFNFSVKEIDSTLFTQILESESIKAIALLDENLANASLDCIKTMEETTFE